jgi:hypothetical protein
MEEWSIDRKKDFRIKAVRRLIFRFFLQASITPFLHYETRIGAISKDDRHIAGLTVKHKVRHAGR